MPANAGRLMTLEVNESGTTWTPIAGARTRSIAVNGTPIDVTTADSTNWRQFLDGEGIKSATIQCAGLLQDVAIEKTIVGYKTGHTLKNWRITVTELGVFEGSFMIASLTYDGAHDGAVQYQITLESSGAVTFTADAT